MKHLVVYFFLFVSLTSLSQNETEYTFTNKTYEIQALLEALESIYDVNFSFNPETLENVSIKLNLKNVRLKTVLEEIETLTNLHFTNYNDRYYSVKKRPFNTFCGYIKDEETGDYLEGATLYNIDTQNGQVTDSKGFFSLKADRNHTIELSFLGYKTQRINLGSIVSNDCISYKLVPKSFVLDDVVLEEYLASGITKLANGSVRIKPKNQDILSGLAEPDILQSVQLLPGIESLSETASGIYIRGGTPDQNLILWDGIKFYNSDHFFGMISAFNPYIVDEVKVSRSGVSPEYGDRVSGVIEMQTDTDIPKSTKSGIGVNMTHADGYLKLPLSDKIGLFFSARHSIKSLINTPTFKAFSEKVFQNTNIEENQDFFDFELNKEKFKFNDITAKIVMQLSDKDKVSISNLFTNNNLDYAFQNQSDFISSDRLKIANTGNSVSWQRTQNDKMSLSAKLYHSRLPIF